MNIKLPLMIALTNLILISIKITKLFNLKDSKINFLIHIHVNRMIKELLRHLKDEEKKQEPWYHFEEDVNSEKKLWN